MAASLKQDYAKILKAGADLVMIAPDSLEHHRQYALKLFGAELPLSLRLGQHTRHRAALRPVPQRRASPRRLLLSLTLDTGP